MCQESRPDPVAVVFVKTDFNAIEFDGFKNRGRDNYG